MIISFDTRKYYKNQHFGIYDMNDKRLGSYYIHEKNWVDLSEFVMGNYYLGTKNINIETYKMNNGLNVDDVDDDIRLAINKIEHLKKSNPIVREYIALSAYLVQLEREIAELKLIAESLKSAPKKDSSNLCLFQEVVKKHRK